MDLRKIKKLIELVEESGIAELEVKSGEEAVRITMAHAAPTQPQMAHNVGSAAAVSGTSAAVSGGIAAVSGGSAAVSGADMAATETAAVSSALASGAVPSGKPLNTPLSGTFYTAPTPDAPAFVAVGDHVSVGDVLCIVESMKMMNRIEADRAGRIGAVLVPNGEPVEAGQPLFLIDSDPV